MGAESHSYHINIDLDELSKNLGGSKSTGQKKIRIVGRLEVIEAMRIVTSLNDDTGGNSSYPTRAKTHGAA